MSVLLLDGGNTLVADDSQPLTADSKSAMIVEAMNLMSYDAAVLGDKDLQLGVDELRKRMDEANFAILSANVLLVDTGELFAKPYTILDVSGWSIGVIGLTGSELDPPAAFFISDPFAPIEKILPELSEQTDLIVVLSHLGWAQNKRLADLAPEIDLVVSGGVETPDQEPHKAIATGTYLAQAERPSPGHAGRQIGRWDLDLGTGDRIATAAWTTVSLGPEFVDDPDMAGLLQRYRDEYESR